jgi:hypothetical protein
LQVKQPQQPEMSLLIQWQMGRPLLGPLDALAPGTPPLGLFHQLGEPQGQPPAQPLPLRLEPAPHLFSADLFGTGQEVTHPARGRCGGLSGVELPFEGGGVEFDRAGRELHVVRLDHESIADEVPELEQRLPQGLARPALVPVGPEQGGRLGAGQGAGTPPRQVCEQHQLLAPARKCRRIGLLHPKLAQSPEMQHGFPRCTTPDNAVQSPMSNQRGAAI